MIKIKIPTDFILVLLILGLSGCRCLIPSKEVERPIYDPCQNGMHNLIDARDSATRSGKRILLSLGANWCGDSQAMYDLLAHSGEIRDEMEAHYIYTLVDVDNRKGEQRNKDVLDSTRTSLDRGIPVLLVLDQNGVVLNRDPEERLRDEDHHNPQKVLDYLRKWSGASEHNHRTDL